MPFKALLGGLLDRVPGAQGAIFADWEGEAIDQAGRMDEYDLKVIGAHQGVILHNLRQANARFGEDLLQEVVITTERSQILVLPVTEDYFLVLTVDRVDVLGKALFEARRCIQSLRREIA